MADFDEIRSSRIYIPVFSPQLFNIFTFKLLIALFFELKVERNSRKVDIYVIKLN